MKWQNNEDWDAEAQRDMKVKLTWMGIVFALGAICAMALLIIELKRHH